MTAFALTGARVFFGGMLHENIAVVIENGHVADLCPKARLSETLTTQALRGGVLAPGFVDLQVNGGGGVMLGDAPGVAGLRRIADAHARLGATTILPTLITDRPEVTRAAIEGVASAIRQGVPGIAGLHLEGPHLARAKAGAHDPALIRPMTDADVTLLRVAAGKLPVLMITLALEAATSAQIASLVRAGAIVSLGHSACTDAEARVAADAGATCVTHLFNAMSGLTARDPGLVGAALTDGRFSAGVIADLIHVAPASLQVALKAKAGPGKLFLVSDAMALAGTRGQVFDLGGRKVRRAQGRLTLEDGTLAGADLTVARGVRHMIDLGAEPERALAMATTIPAGLIGRNVELAQGAVADLVHLSEDWQLKAVWQAGTRL